jgi:hypothetical protein
MYERRSKEILKQLGEIVININDALEEIRERNSDDN